VVQPVFFVNEFLAAAGAFYNCPAMIMPCVGNQFSVILEFPFTILTSVVITTEEFQSHYLLGFTIKNFKS